MVPKPAGATSLATCGTVVARSLQPLRMVQTGSYRLQVRLFRCCVQGSLIICWFVFYRIHRYSLFERLNCFAEMIYSWFLWCFLVAFFPWILQLSIFSSHGSKVLQSKLSFRNTQITFRHSAVLCPQWSWRVFGASPCLETLLCTITSKHLCESMMLSGKKKGFQKDWHGESVVPFLLSIVQCAQPVKTARTFILVLSRAQEDFYTSNLTSSDSDGLCVGKDHVIPSAFATLNCGFKQFCAWHVMKTLQKPWEGVVPFSFKLLSARDAGRSVA